MTITKIARALVADHVRAETKMAGLYEFLSKPGVGTAGMALSTGLMTVGAAGLAKDDLDTKKLIALGLLGAAGGAYLGHKMNVGWTPPPLPPRYSR